MPPVSMVRPTTRSPALTCASAGADRTTPAISAPKHERRVRAVLVEAAGQQCVGEGRAGRVHVDDHSVAGRFVDLADLDSVRTVQPGQLCCAHATSVR